MKDLFELRVDARHSRFFYSPIDEHGEATNMLMRSSHTYMSFSVTAGGEHRRPVYVCRSDAQGQIRDSTGHRLRQSTCCGVVEGWGVGWGALLGTGVCIHCMNSYSELLHLSDTASLKLVEEPINYISETSLYLMINFIHNIQ